MTKTEDFFSAEETDILGETFNISLGSSSKAINMILDRPVSITEPHVEVLMADEFHLSELEYVLAVEITYVRGLKGRNLLLLKKNDIRKILEIMMMTEFDEATFEIDELGESAVCELMNQMMGAAATSMSTFLDMAVDISTPATYRIVNETLFKREFFERGQILTMVKFDIDIEDTLKSEFYNIMTYEFASDVVKLARAANNKSQI
ncbi:MAG: chemotaxis protein CheC [Anaerovoracaceae bacterium]